MSWEPILNLPWEQISNLPFSPGLLGGFVGSFLVLAAGHFVTTGSVF